MQTLLITIIIASFLIEIILEVLNLKSWEPEVPKLLKDTYENDKYQKAHEYKEETTKLSLIVSTFNTVLLLVLVFTGFFNWLNGFSQDLTASEITASFIFLGTLFITSDILNLPFSLYSTFKIEQKYGFNKTDLKTFFIDKIKGYILMALIAGPVLFIVFNFYKSSGDNFWLYSWILISVVIVIFNTFYTTLIVPIFNKLKPLEDNDLRQKIEEYSKKVDFPLDDILVIDASKRSTKTNAYFSGLGRKKTIVLFDTLIEKMKDNELTAILAHEVGHYKKHHVLQMLVLSILQMGVMIYLFSLFLDTSFAADALGVEDNNFHIGLLGFGLLFSPISLVIGTAMNFLSRRNEYQADNFAAKTFEAEALQNSLKKLSVDNLMILTPHPLYVFINYSHPPILKRLENLNG